MRKILILIFTKKSCFKQLSKLTKKIEDNTYEK